MIRIRLYIIWLIHWMYHFYNQVHVSDRYLHASTSSISLVSMTVLLSTFSSDLDFFSLIIFIFSSSLELLGSQMLHCVTFWCVNPPILPTTAIINGSIYVNIDFVVLMFQF
ncbi:hypothetical protein HanRHA438_Chr15g0690181 [Helianthus annuus]|uniref:Uncharacterized protein n=1 Tax=Helianthus annuus TaxID=4232 RepID=A0A251S5P8_HELAN|nr:hypothetical protein HanXRQr2_Chr15g0677741 [Helianthus annuus]KAJ0651385.1 hypothetical protein HanOQP8_Chr15g0560421 [Helianthus annuus]KAJ0829961.1 hypothetical protein HanPSC8_Chr15g0649771 [Helianthus annuus]KAJ0843328.1 hypothetical protein HanRHA438_Chr15g0690181 [Helianthus annuus]